MTVSAPVRLIPNPPALVAMMKIKIFGLRLNLSVSFCLSSVLVAPSSRRYVKPQMLIQLSSTLSILVICVKMRQNTDTELYEGFYKRERDSGELS